MAKYSEAFTKMAAMIEHNEESSFVGAAVIVLPGIVTAPIEIIQLGSNMSEGQFWAILLTEIQVRMKKIEEQQMAGRTFGIR